MVTLPRAMPPAEHNGFATAGPHTKKAAWPSTAAPPGTVGAAGVNVAVSVTGSPSRAVWEFEVAVTFAVSLLIC